uniref:NADH dehydrogenase [ubiquinone] 1 alpha subcomplex subunit 9, mitochondrial n=1 Tax=Setaria digitata TaxID=48799 RepID=A0A915PSY8_9BILA
MGAFQNSKHFSVWRWLSKIYCSVFQKKSIKRPKSENYLKKLEAVGSLSAQSKIELRRGNFISDTLNGAAHLIRPHKEMSPQLSVVVNCLSNNPPLTTHARKSLIKFIGTRLPRPYYDRSALVPLSHKLKPSTFSQGLLSSPSVLPSAIKSKVSREQAVEDWQLPVILRRKPISERECNAINKAKMLVVSHIRRYPLVGFEATICKALYCSTSATQLDLPKPSPTSKLAAFRKGTGGRCSFSGNVVTVFGCTGMLGKLLVNRLAKEGHQIILPSRQEPYYTRQLRIYGELGQILLLPFQLKDEESIRQSMRYSNVVVNLIGTRYETKNYSFEETHVEGARRIARIAKEMGIQKFIHMSAMNATKDTPPTLFNKPSRFLLTKGLGEEVVRQEFPTATIIRPSMMYGGNCDAFINYFLAVQRIPYRSLIFVYKKGEHTYKMPIWVGDVSKGVERTIVDPHVTGKTYEFVGPHCYKLSELIDYMYDRAHLSSRFLHRHYRRRNLNYLYRAYVAAVELPYKFFRNPSPLSFEWIRVVECTSDVLTGCPTLQDLGITRLVEFELTGGKHAYFCVNHYNEPEVTEPYPLPLRSPPLYANIKQNDEVITETKPFTMSNI